MDLERELEKIIGLTGGELTLRMHDVAGRVAKIKHLIETREGEIKEKIKKSIDNTCSNSAFKAGFVTREEVNEGIDKIFGR